MKSAYAVIMIAVCSVAICAQNPVPLVNNPLVPSSAVPGGASFTLTVNGTGFVSASTVNWNGTPLQTTFVSGSQLTATVPAANIATATTGAVSVVSPVPGGGVSNIAWFSVRKPFPAASFGETEVPAGNLPALPVVADFNGDGKLDVAAIASGDSAISILIGNGNGGFSTPTEYPVPTGTLALITGDFNGDGLLDLLGFNGNTLVLLGNGDGTFQAHKDTVSGVFGQGIACADLNADGKLDVAIATSTPAGQVAVMLGNGDGTFQGSVLYDVGSSAAFVATGDFDRDGQLDIAVTSGSFTASGFVAIFLGNGDGTFRNPVDVPVPLDPQGIVAGDFNSDSKLDLAIKTPAAGAPGLISVLLGNGDGSFQLPISYESSDDFLLTAAELNGDGKLDLVIPTFEKTQVLLGTGDGHLGPLGVFPSEKFSFGAAAGDFNGDGLIDLVVGDISLGSGLAVLPQLTSVLSETLTYFGSVKLGKSKTRQVTLMNYGDKVLSIDLIGVQGDDASVFSETNDCGSGVQPGASCKIAITFTPQRPRQYTMARVAIRDSATRLSQKIMLEGMGLK